jgi:hypothetical protein
MEMETLKETHEIDVEGEVDIEEKLINALRELKIERKKIKAFKEELIKLKEISQNPKEFSHLKIKIKEVEKRENVLTSHLEEISRDLDKIEVEFN